jgi:glucosamine--fructose-6-phosphate aminotransferase (isomerizing)
MQAASRLIESIRAQPEILRRVLVAAPPRVRDIAPALMQARRVLLSGTGTNSHAAVVGQYLLRSVGADAWATTNFDFVHYGPPVDRRDVVVVLSHTGTTRYGHAAIARAREGGAYVIGITGEGSPMDGPDVVIPAGPTERSDTYTKSYTATLAVLGILAAEVGERLGADVAELRAAVDRVPDDVAGVLRREETVRPVAQALAERGRLVLAGAGPNRVTAREGALKVKESSYLVAEGFELETMLHGGLQAVESGDVAVLIAAKGPALERVSDAARALETIGARAWLIADEAAISSLGPASYEWVTPHPGVPEVLSPLTATVPLQLLAALTAQLRGTNPDNFRYDEDRYRNAIEGMTL